MPKIEIDVDQILTVAVPLEDVQPGDRLIVMNGLVVKWIPAAQVARAALVAAHKPAEPVAEAAPEGGRHWGQMQAADLIRQHGPINARDLSDKLKLDPAERHRLGAALRAARDAGRVESVPNSGRYPTYRLPTRSIGNIQEAAD